MRMFIQLLCLSLTAFGLIAADSVKPPLFQIRLVEERATAETERMTITRLIKNEDRTVEEVVHVRRNPALDLADVASATVRNHIITGEPEVLITFTRRGRKTFADFTRRNVGKLIAVVVDGRLVDVPKINEEITGGQGLISGRFSERGGFSAEEAADLAARINKAVK